MNKKKTLGIVLGIFALVIVTTAASFAFFTYSRTGNTKASIVSGDIEFSYIEGESASLTNAFPVSDEIGAIDETGEYKFEVSLKSSSATTANYNVYLVDNNTSTNHFTNEQIKFALIKNDVFVANTSATEGLKLSTLDGFDEGSYNGEGIVLSDQEISSGETDNYKLRIWISDDVSYNNDYQTDGTMDGKYNGYTYSLKVKVTSGITNNISINNLQLDGIIVTADLSDPNGLSAYAVTNNSETPSADSDEWIEITSDTAKSNVVRTATDKVTSKTISYVAKEIGMHYLHVKNNNNETKSKSIDVKINEIQPVSGSAAEYIMNLAKSNTSELRKDLHNKTKQTDITIDYRYWGSNPNNYVEFNDEMWRIIGVFDVDDGNGNIEKRVKLIRDDSIGSYSWDSSETAINGGYGVSEWSQADLMTLLNNGAYYNRTTGICYNGSNNSTTSCDFSTIGLASEAKEMLGNAKWYLGAGKVALTVSEIYEQERGEILSKQCTQGDTDCTDEIERKKSWVGSVGLLYPSDFGYSADLSLCSDKKLSGSFAPAGPNSPCSASSWLANTVPGWTITAMNGNYGNRVFSVGYLLSTPSPGYAIINNKIKPSVYLSADVKIVGGTGEKGTNAFKLSK